MAVELLGATNDVVNCGDFNYTDRQQITIAVTINPSGITNGERLASEWGPIGGNQAWLCEIADNDEIAFIVSNGAFSYYGRKTSGLDMVTGTLYRVVCKWRGSGVGGPSIQIFVNGAEQGSLGVYVGSGSFTAFVSSVGEAAFGYTPLEGTDGVDGSYSEMMIAENYLSDDACLSISKGFSPSFYRAQATNVGRVYVPAVRDATFNVWAVPAEPAITATITSVTQHPPVVYPAEPHIHRVNVAAAPATTARPKIDGHLAAARLVGGALVA